MTDGGGRNVTALRRYFDNTDAKLRAPIDAQSLMRKLGIGAAPARRDPAPGGIFLSQEAKPARLG